MEAAGDVLALLEGVAGQQRVRSPLVTAVATSAMARTWVVRLAASWLTLSVSARQVPAAPGTLACPPSFPSTPTSRATVVT